MKTRFKVQKYKEANFTRIGEGQLVAEAGKALAEAFEQKGMGTVLKEQFGITFKEDVTTTTASGAYTTLLSKTLYTAAIENIKDILELVNVNEDMMNGNGFGAYQIPKLEPTVAVEVAEGAVVNYFDEGVDSITVTPRKVVAGTAITWEILKRGMSDFARFVLQNAADAVTRKIATDILDGLVVGAGNTVGGGVSYDAIIDAQTGVQGATNSNGVPFGFVPTHLVLSSSAFGALQKTTDWKNTVYYANAIPGAVDVTINRPALMFGTMKIVPTPFLTNAEALVIDATKAAMLVKESDLETFEGALPGRPYDREVVALMSYTLAVLYPDAIYAITA